MDPKLSQIEAILFAAGEPVAKSKLATFLKLKEKELRSFLKELSDFYESQKSGLAIVQTKKQVQLVSAPKQGRLIADFLKKELHEPLSPSALEVLSIIAYRGPITHSGIEEIRGANSSFILRNLSIKGLIERKENPLDSRSYVYEVSLDFIKALGLGEVGELPDFEKLSQEEKSETERQEKKEL
ncbi:MAG TPA: SMC-Scp complex subunit ScpB [Candidatus Moranbacteria bacterium]|nr:SMC-Scp complex subunit ScpB [Candidatus Moranbacteria bacterium]